MEYERTEDGQIQAAFAQRLGQLLVQYDHWRQQVPEAEQFESTLTIALLQSLLTMCQELIYSKPEPGDSAYTAVVQLAKRSLEDEPVLLGLSRDCVVQRWPSERDITYREVIECLRHALSHPGHQTNEGFPRTGFISVPGSSGMVEAYEFTQSPWVNRTGSGLSPKWFSNVKSADPPEKLVGTVKDWASNARVNEIEVKQLNGRWQPARHGQPFIPVLRLRIDVRQLRVFTAELSDYLSESVRSKGAVPTQTPSGFLKS
jgi:hypothetical protein